MGVGLNAELVYTLSSFVNMFISYRTKEVGLLISRPPQNVGRFKMVRHQKTGKTGNGCINFIFTCVSDVLVL